MMELAKAIQLLGLPHMWKLKRGYEVGWQEMFHGYFATQVMHTLFNVGFIDEIVEKGSVDVDSSRPPGTLIRRSYKRSVNLSTLCSFSRKKVQSTPLTPRASCWWKCCVAGSR